MQEYLDALLEIREREQSLTSLMLELEFPPQGVVSIEWAQSVESLQTNFASLILDWHDVEPPPEFEEHHQLYQAALNADLAVADAMHAWIGVGPNRQARNERVESYEAALESRGQAFAQAQSAYNDALANVESEDITLEETPVTLAQLSLTEISSRVTEKNESRWLFAWKVTARNLTQDALEIAISIRWLDADGFIIDSANEFELRLEPNASRTFAGSEHINLPAAMNVHELELEVIQLRVLTP